MEHRRPAIQGAFPSSSSTSLPRAAPWSTRDEPTPFCEGELVDVWSNSKRCWFEDGFVETIATASGIISSRPVTPGMVLVRFDVDKAKWLHPAELPTSLRRSPQRWVAAQKDDALPERAVLAGRTDNDPVYVARGGQGEPCSVQAKDALGPRRLKVPHGLSKDSRWQILVLGRGFAARWLAIKVGDPVPQGAVASQPAGAISERPSPPRVFVARDDGNLCGLVAADVDGTLVVESLGFRMCQDGQVLVIEAASATNEVFRELQVEVLRAEGVRDSAFRLGDHFSWAMGLKSLKIYAELEVSEQGETWRSGYREVSKAGSVDIGERAYLVIPGPKEASSLNVRVLDRRPNQGLVGGDALVGACSLRLSPELLAIDGEVPLDLERDGSSHGKLFLRLGLWAKEERVEAQLLPQVDDALKEWSDGTEAHLTTLLAAAAAVPVGSSILVLAQADQDLPFEHLDGGLATEVLRGLGKVTTEPSKFHAFLTASFQGSSSGGSADTGSWNLETLSELDEKLGLDQATSPTGRLLGQPRGGALIVSASGTTLAAAARLKASGWEALPRLLLPSGFPAATSLGDAALACAWASSAGVQLAAFVRVDAGLCVLLSTSGPRAFQAMCSRLPRA